MRRAALAAFSIVLGGNLTFALETPQQAAPDDAMMQPVRELVSFMITLDAAHLRQSFASRDLTVMENFAPYLFTGRGARLQWEQGFRRHAADGNLSELSADFAQPITFERDAGRVYFSLPTTWTGKSNGQRFVEHGAWAFVLTSTRNGWRIRSYSWAVTEIAAVD